MFDLQNLGLSLLPQGSARIGSTTFARQVSCLDFLLLVCGLTRSDLFLLVIHVATPDFSLPLKGMA